MIDSQIHHPQFTIHNSLMLVTQSDLMKPSFEEALEDALRGGAKLVQLREKDPIRVLESTHIAAKLCEKYSAQLQLNCGEQSWELARELKVGVHLPEQESVHAARDLLGTNAFIGKSVHTVGSAQNAEKDGANYLVFGSIFPTNSHPGETPVGLEELRKVATSVSIPVLAIGGVDARNASLCVQNGAYGVAVISAVWRSKNIKNAVQELEHSLIAHDVSTHIAES